MPADVDKLSGRRYWRLLICLACAMVALAVERLPPVRALEYTTYDLRIRLNADFERADSDIVIVAIDDESLNRMESAVGRWPWPRFVLAAIVDYCSTARAIGFDILLAETDHDTLGDELLVDKVNAHGGVISAVYFIEAGAGETGVALPSTSRRHAIVPHPDRLATVPEYPSAVFPFPSLLDAVAGLGSVTHKRDDDGVLRTHQLMARHDGALYPSLPLALAMQYRTPPAIHVDHTGAVVIGSKALPTDHRNGLRLVPSSESHTVISAADVIDAWQTETPGVVPTLSRDVFAGKIVLVGSMATGLHADQEVTSLGAATHGVALNATALDNIIHGRGLRATPPVVVIFLTILLALIPGVPRLDHPRAVIACVTTVLLTYSVIGAAFLIGMHIMLPATGPGLAVLTAGAAIGGMNWLTERTSRHRLEALEKAKQQFTDMLVHDMKNRVAPVIMAIRIMQDTLADEGDELALTPVLETARLSTERLLIEMKSLLDIRKMSDGYMQLTRRPISVRHLLTQAVDEMTPAAAKLNLNLAVVEPIPDVRLNVDKNIFNRVLINLLWNAVDHSPAESTIEITGTCIDDMVQLAVANDGPVIPAEIGSQLFDAYVSGKTTTNEHTVSGTGLGLAFCRLALEAHQGRVWIESPRPNHGSGVTVHIEVGPTNEDE